MPTRYVPERVDTRKVTELFINVRGHRRFHSSTSIHLDLRDLQKNEVRTGHDCEFYKSWSRGYL